MDKLTPFSCYSIIIKNTANCNIYPTYHSHLLDVSSVINGF